MINRIPLSSCDIALTLFNLRDYLKVQFQSDTSLSRGGLDLLAYPGGRIDNGSEDTPNHRAGGHRTIWRPRRRKGSGGLHRDRELN